MESGKASIYSSFREYNTQDFGYLSYGMITLEHIDTQVQVYKKGTILILDLLDLESTKDDGR